MADRNVLAVVDLCKYYGSILAVDHVSFDVNLNEIVGLLGPNGAGKTTIINMILGVLQPTEGKIYIEGIDISTDRCKALERTNFAAVYAPLPGNLTVYENLMFFGLLYNVKDLKDKIEQAISLFELGRFRNTKCGVLSSGEQTRVGLAKALLSGPRLLLLDEPTASLDPANAREVRDRIRSFAKKEAVGLLWTSHNMVEVESVCDRVLFLSHGKILLEGNPRTLPQEYGMRNLEELFIAVAKEPLTIEDGS